MASTWGRTVTPAFQPLPRTVPWCPELFLFSSPPGTPLVPPSGGLLAPGSTKGVVVPAVRRSCASGSLPCRTSSDSSRTGHVPYGVVQFCPSWALWCRGHPGGKKKALKTGQIVTTLSNPAEGYYPTMPNLERRRQLTLGQHQPIIKRQGNGACLHSASHNETDNARHSMSPSHIIPSAAISQFCLSWQLRPSERI